MANESRQLYQAFIKKGMQKEDAFLGHIFGIQLSQGKVAWVDPRDYQWLSQWRWTAHRIGKTRYAVRNENLDGKVIRVLMHQVVGAKAGWPVVDHRDRNGLHNMRRNLRPANKSLNGANSDRKLGISGFRGVTRSRSKWRCQITVNYANIHIGVYDSAGEAARVYDKAALKYFGEFASLNFPVEHQDGK